MLAQYMAVERKIINKMKKMSDEEIIEEIEELSDNEGCDICDVDKMWDALHFFLTGKPLFAPLKNNKLSEAAAGTEVFNNDSDDFLAYIKHEELPSIIEAMEKVDTTECIKAHPVADYEKNKVYPNIWKNIDKDEIFDEILFCFEGLLDFYKNCYKKKLDVVISIY